MAGGGGPIGVYETIISVPFQVLHPHNIEENHPIIVTDLGMLPKNKFLSQFENKSGIIFMSSILETKNGLLNP